MAFWWKKNPKTPAEYTKALGEQLDKLSSPASVIHPQDKRKVLDECSKYLSGIRQFLLGDDENDPQPDAIAEIAQEVYSSDVLLYTFQFLSEFDFDTRKDVSILFTTLLRRQIGNRSPTVDYLVMKPKILHILLRSPGDINDVVLTTGALLRECIKHEALCKIILRDEYWWKYFEYANSGSFESSTECFQTLTELLTCHKKLVAAEVFAKRSDSVIEKLNKMVAQGNYVTKRQSVKLLASLILVRANNALMTKYINSGDNLKLIMMLLSDRSKNLQLEAFNVFKVFVANPKKSKPVLDILIKNRDKLLLYFGTFQQDVKDSTFLDEKEFVVQQIEELPRINS